jgi:hypothetical protein
MPWAQDSESGQLGQRDCTCTQFCDFWGPVSSARRSVAKAPGGCQPEGLNLAVFIGKA